MQQTTLSISRRPPTARQWVQMQQDYYAAIGPWIKRLAAMVPSGYTWIDGKMTVNYTAADQALRDQIAEVIGTIARQIFGPEVRL